MSGNVRAMGEKGRTLPFVSEDDDTGPHYGRPIYQAVCYHRADDIGAVMVRERNRVN